MGGLPTRYSTIHGRAQFEDGQPVPRFDVVVWARTPGYQNRKSVASPDGHFQVDGVPRGEIELWLENTDIPVFLSDRESIRLVNDQQHLDLGIITVPRLTYARLRGSVSVPEGVAPDVVWLAPRSYRCAWPVPVGREFEIEIPTDCTWIEFFAPGLSRYLWKADSPLSFSEGDVVQLPEIELRSTRRVRGCVELRDGQPCPKAKVSIGSNFSGFRDGGKPTWWSGDNLARVGVQYSDETEADANGRFSFADVPPIELYLLAYNDDQVGLAPLDPADDEVKVRLELGGTVSGVVESRASQQPVVSLHSLGERPWVVKTTGLLCEKDGRFASPPLPAGTYEIHCRDTADVRQGPQGTVEYSESTVEVHAGAHAVISLELHAGRTISLAFESKRRVEALWSSLSSLWTDACSAIRTLHQTTQDAGGGTGKFTNVPVGSYTLRVQVVLIDADGRRLLGNLGRTVEISDDASDEGRFEFSEHDLDEISAPERPSGVID